MQRLSLYLLLLCVLACSDGADIQSSSILPAETQLLVWAKEKGCRYSNGLEMMFFQGAAAFKLWTGKDMPLDVVREVFKAE